MVLNQGEAILHYKNGQEKYITVDSQSLAHYRSQEYIKEVEVLRWNGVKGYHPYGKLKQLEPIDNLPW